MIADELLLCPDFRHSVAVSWSMLVPMPGLLEPGLNTKNVNNSRQQQSFISLSFRFPISPDASHESNRNITPGAQILPHVHMYIQYGVHTLHKRSEDTLLRPTGILHTSYSTVNWPQCFVTWRWRNRRSRRASLKPAQVVPHHDGLEPHGVMASHRHSRYPCTRLTCHIGALMEGESSF